MRRRKLEKPQVPLSLEKTIKWQKYLKALANKIRKEYENFSAPTETSIAVMYAEYLIAAALFLERANDMLAEHQEVILRHEAWEDAQKRKLIKKEEYE